MKWTERVLWMTLFALSLTGAAQSRVNTPEHTGDERTYIDDIRRGQFVSARDRAFGNLNTWAVGLSEYLNIMEKEAWVGHGERIAALEKRVAALEGKKNPKSKGPPNP